MTTLSPDDKYPIFSMVDTTIYQTPKHALDYLESVYCIDCIFGNQNSEGIYQCDLVDKEPLLWYDQVYEIREDDGYIVCLFYNHKD